MSAPKTSVVRGILVFLITCFWLVTMPSVRAEDLPVGRPWEWNTASPESQGMNSAALESAWSVLKNRHTTALLVIRHDRIVFERYCSRIQPDQASLHRLACKGTRGRSRTDGGDGRRAY